MTSPVFLFSGIPSLKKAPLYITPTGAGAFTGVGMENAGRLSDLNALIATANTEEREIHVRADLGDYARNAALTISNGGVVGNPVKIKGVDANGVPMHANIIGGRYGTYPADPWVKGLAYGTELFRLNIGANFLHFSFLHPQKQGNACFRFRQSVNGVIIEDCKGTNVAGFIDNTAPDSASVATITNLVVRRCEVNGYSKRVARIQYDSSNILLEDVAGDSQFQDADNFCIGVEFNDTAHDIIVRRCSMINQRDSTHGYWNADGFSTEEVVYNLHFEDCYSAHNTDSGYDIKSKNVTMLRCTGEDSKRNFRIWGEVVMTDCIGLRPFKRGGTGSAGNIGVYANSIAMGYCRVYGGHFEMAPTGTYALTRPFEVQKDGFLAVTARTTLVYSASEVVTLETGAQFVGNLNESDVTPPAITSSLTLSLNENLPGKFLMTGGEPFQLKAVGGADIGRIRARGRYITVSPQDFENPSHSPSYSALIRAYDQNGNTSEFAVTVTINDVADAPITPSEVFSDPSTNGFWYQPNVLSSLFEDEAGTIPAVVNGEVRKMLDLSGRGNHCVFSEDANQAPDNPIEPPILRTDGEDLWLEVNGASRGLVGAHNSLKFASFSQYMCIWRAEEAISEETIISFPRSATAGTSTNSQHAMRVLGNVTVGARFNQNNYTAAGNGLTVRNVGALTIQNDPSTMRANNTFVTSGSLATMPASITPAYTVSGNPINGRWVLFARGVPSVYNAGTGVYTNGWVAKFSGRFYGGVMTNKVDDLDTRFRIERQIAQWGGKVL